MRKITPKTDEYMQSGIGALKKQKAKPIYPTFRMDLQHLPEAKSSKLGDMHQIKMHAKLVGLNQSRFDHSAEYEIHAIEHKKMHGKGGDEEAGETVDKSEQAD